MNDSKKSISLVLGSGGARGLAHVGIIQWLEEHDYTIQSISGCSMGAVVGGVYALGKLDEFSAWVKAVNTFEMLRLLDFSLGRGGLVKGDKIINTLAELTGHSLIEELPIPFTAVAADIDNGKEVWISHGPIFDAIRASISIPLLFAPVERNSVRLLDGGILNPVPIAPTFKDHTDLTIAVNLSGPPDGSLVDKNQESKKKELSNTPSRPKVNLLKPAEMSALNKEAEPSALAKRISQFIDTITPDMNGDGLEKTLNQSPKRTSSSMYDVAYQAMDAMQGTIARQKLATYPPDCLLEVPRNLCGFLEFDRAEELIAFGYELAEQQLSGLHKSPNIDKQ